MKYQKVLYEFLGLEKHSKKLFINLKVLLIYLHYIVEVLIQSRLNSAVVVYFFWLLLPRSTECLSCDFFFFTFKILFLFVTIENYFLWLGDTDAWPRVVLFLLSDKSFWYFFRSSSIIDVLSFFYSFPIWGEIFRFNDPVP